MSKPLTKEFLISKGKCCGKQCQNCPYIPKYTKGSTQIEEEIKLLDELLDDVESGKLTLGFSAHKCYMNKDHKITNHITWIHDDELKKYLVLRSLASKVDRAVQKG
jgi:hypothetical protein